MLEQVEGWISGDRSMDNPPASGFEDDKYVDLGEKSCELCAEVE